VEKDAADDKAEVLIAVKAAHRRSMKRRQLPLMTATLNSERRVQAMWAT